MPVIYLSYFLDHQTPAYGGEQGLIQFEKMRSITKGDVSNNLKLELPNHIGTHIDFPRHFSNEGKSCSDYPASFWSFEKVGFIQCNVDQVEQAVQTIPDDIELLILKTGFGAKRKEKEYWSAQPIIKASLADLLHKKFKDLRVFGFDMISLTSKLDRAEGKLAHQCFLLQNEILILEDMDLKYLHYTPKKVIIAPLLISDADGAPCTVISFDN
jgi:arylformamidase